MTCVVMVQVGYIQLSVRLIRDIHNRRLNTLVRILYISIGEYTDSRTRTIIEFAISSSTPKTQSFNNVINPRSKDYFSCPVCVCVSVRRIRYFFIFNGKNSTEWYLLKLKIKMIKMIKMIK